MEFHLSLGKVFELMIWFWATIAMKQQAIIARQEA
jgi:hypothetical protein